MNIVSGKNMNSYYPSGQYNSKTDRNTSSAAVPGYNFSEEFIKSMTLEQYKQYINDKISNMPVHPSQSGKTWIFDISDEGYEAMKNNPEYEKYVLDTIRSNLSARFGSKVSGTSVLHFGATEEESYGEGESFSESELLNDSAEDWWEKRMRLMSENLKQRVIMTQKRQKERSEFEKGMIFAERLNAADRQREFLNEGKTSNNSTDKNSIRSRAAIAAYRLSLIMKDSDII